MCVCVCVSLFLSLPLILTPLPHTTHHREDGNYFPCFASLTREKLSIFWNDDADDDDGVEEESDSSGDEGGFRKKGKELFQTVDTRRVAECVEANGTLTMLLGDGAVVFSEQNSNTGTSTDGAPTSSTPGGTISYTHHHRYVCLFTYVCACASASVPLTYSNPFSYYTYTYTYIYIYTYAYTHRHDRKRASSHSSAFSPRAASSAWASTAHPVRTWGPCFPMCSTRLPRTQ